MRKNWFDYVASIRKKESKKSKEPCSHRKAMSVASQSWPSQKLKLQRKVEREKRKAAKVKKTEPVPAHKDQET